MQPTVWLRQNPNQLPHRRQGGKNGRNESSQARDPDAGNLPVSGRWLQRSQ